MSNSLRTNQELLQENAALKQKIRELEQSAALQKQAEEELRCSWQQLRLLIDAGPDFFFLKDLQFRYQLVNFANSRFFGRDEAEILGRTDFDLMPEEAALACRESDERAIRDRTLVVTIEAVGDRFYETHKFPLLVAGEVVGVAGIIRDITDRKQAEEALRKNEELQHTILSHVGAYIYLKDKQGRYSYVNNKVCELFGLKTDEIIGKDDTSFFSATSVEEIRKSDLRVLEYGETVTREETDLISSNKVPRTYWVVKLPLKDSRGNIFGLCGISTNITDLKQAGEAFRESEERFRLLCESSQDAILMMDHEGIVSYWNPAAERMFGYTSVEAVGRDLHELIMPERFREAYLAAYPEFVRTGRGAAIGRTLEMQAMRKDGSEITIALSLSAEWIKDGWNALGILRDITEQKEAKEALKRSESRLASIIEFLPDATFAIDLEGKVISWNRALEELTGFSEEEMLGKGNYEYAIPFYGERRPLFVDLLLSWDDEIAGKYSFIKKEGDTVYAEAEVHFVRRPSRMMWGKASLLRNERGEVIGAIETMRDVTDRKLLESQLLQAQKMEAIGTLAGGVAHDFNNILMGIEGYVSLMLQETDPHHPHHERLNYIEDQVQSASDLTRQLLGFARVGRYETQPTDLNQLIKKSSTMFSRTKRELTITRKYEKNLWTVEVDRGQIKQALLNLYLNAWHAMPAGGKLSLETRNFILEESFATLHAVPPGNYVMVRVVDTGSGMDEETKKRIFDPFFTTREMGRGTGLGLAMVYGIIKGHNGFITVESEPGCGATFTIYLPASEEKVLPESPAKPEFLRGNETILIVDDEPTILAVSKAMLEFLGYTVHDMMSGTEAIDFYKEEKNKIDLVILDMIMPELSGGETFDRIREINPMAKVMLSSGYSLDGQAQQILTRGCRGFIQKPFNIESLSGKVREVLGK